MYSGPAGSATTYFEGLGYPLPTFVNPSEFLLDLTMVDNRSPLLESSSRRQREALMSAWQKYSEEQVVENLNQERGDQGCPRVILERDLKKSFVRTDNCTDSSSLESHLQGIRWVSPQAFWKVLLLASYAVWIFFRTDETLSGIQSREGALYCAAVLQGYLVLLQETYRLSLEIPLFDTEHRKAIISTLSFLISCRLAKLLPEDLTVPLLFSITIYFLAGFIASREPGSRILCCHLALPLLSLSR